jgi:hydroxymethylbilane synthase
MNKILKKIRVGTRSSKLALAQATEICNLIEKYSPNIKTQIVPIVTSGDKIQNKNLWDIGGKALFLKELEESLIQDKIDIAVHSAKDVPPEIHKNTKILAFAKRLDAHDCFISKKYDSINDLPLGAVVGTSSARRKSILLRMRPDLKIINFRGNVYTRLKKIDNDEADATILAACVFDRLGKFYENDQPQCPKGFGIKKIIKKSQMLPAGGQGSLIIQGKDDFDNSNGVFEKINDSNTEIAIMCERSFLSELGASCCTPVSVHAEIFDKKLYLKTAIYDYDGSQIYETDFDGNADIKTAITLGKKASNRTKENAQSLLAKIIRCDI